MLCESMPLPKKSRYRQTTGKLLRYLEHGCPFRVAVSCSTLIEMFLSIQYCYLNGILFIVFKHHRLMHN